MLSTVTPTQEEIGPSEDAMYFLCARCLSLSSRLAWILLDLEPYPKEFAVGVVAAQQF